MNGIPPPAGDDNDYPDNGHIARKQYDGNLNDGTRGVLPGHFATMFRNFMFASQIPWILME
jgi:hypothetical protein